MTNFRSHFTLLQLSKIIDKLTFQSDAFFWELVILHSVTYILEAAKLIPEGSGYTTSFILQIFAVSWIYLNSRRRDASIIRASFFALICIFSPLIAGVIYFVFRPRELPDQPAFSPYVFFVQIIFWLTGLAFLLIGILEMCK